MSPNGQCLSESEVPELSTDPSQLYVQYLSTDAIAAAVAKIDEDLSTRGGEFSTRQKQVHRAVRADLMRELGRRQLRILDNGAGGPTAA